MTYRELLELLKVLPASELDKDVMVLMTKYGECIKIRDAEMTGDIDIDIPGETERFMLIE